MTSKTESQPTNKTPKKTCGIIMPISSQPGCSADHWVDVRTIIEESIFMIEEFKFEARIVSDADDVGVIQKRIVQNIYTSDIVICDVSCKNANVMFELGMRLAFDKPTVIIKDDQTDYSFDTGVIEHLTYPRDLRFSKIVQFKKLLSEKVLATYKASLDTKNSTFLKNFGTFHVSTLNQDITSPDRLTLEMLTELQLEFSRLRRDIKRTPVRRAISNVHTEELEDVKVKLERLIMEYKTRENLSDVLGLIDDSEFLSEVEVRLPAPHYFKNYDDFKSAVSKALISHSF